MPYLNFLLSDETKSIISSRHSRLACKISPLYRDYFNISTATIQRLSLVNPFFEFIIGRFRLGRLPTIPRNYLLDDENMLS